MNPVDELLARNATYAEGHRPAALGGAGLGVLVLSCADGRADPAHVLGLGPGEGVVLRNVGGRVGPRVLQDLAALALVRAAEGFTPGAGPGMVLLVLQHTDCGIQRLPDAVVADQLGVPVDGLAAKAVHDPVASVRVDVALLRGVLPAGLRVAGAVLDVRTGRVALVEPAADGVPVTA